MDVKFIISLLDSLPGQSSESSTVRFVTKNHTSFYCFDEFFIKSANYLPAPSHNDNVAYFEFSKKKFSSVVQHVLLQQKLCAELYVVEAKSLVLSKRATPGNLASFESYLKDVHLDQTNTLCFFNVNLVSKMVSFAVSYNNDYLLESNEFIDDAQFGETCVILLQIEPTELIIHFVGGGGKSNIATDSNVDNILSILDKNNIRYWTNLDGARKCDVKPVASIDSSKYANYINCIHPESKPIYFKFSKELPCAFTCLITLLQYIIKNDISLKDYYQHQYKLAFFKHEQFLILEKSVIKTLNLVAADAKHDYMQAAAAQKSSLYDLLDNCQTRQGQRLLQKWIVQPLKDENAINCRLAVVAGFVDRDNARSHITTVQKNFLKSLPDLCQLCSRIKRCVRSNNVNDPVKLYTCVNRLNALYEHVKVTYSNSIALMESMSGLLQMLVPFMELIESTVKLDSLMSDSVSQYKINPNIDPELNSIDEEIAALKKKMEKRLKKKIAALDFLEETNRNFGGIRLDYAPHRGYFYKCSPKDADALFNFINNNNNPDDYKILETLNDGLRFTDDKMQQYNEIYESLTKKYDEMQDRFVSELYSVTSSYTPVFTSLNEVVAQLDVFISLSLSAIDYNLKRPTILSDKNKNIINFKSSRHLCIEQTISEKSSFVTNDIVFGGGDNENENEANFMILTGPNMGGKSTYLRQCALIVVMAQMGCYVPCEQCSLTVFDRILTRIGASDSLNRGMSTFMAEMTDMAGIMNRSNDRCLVLIDELGRGTSTYDGLGLCWEISKALLTEERYKNCVIMFATHFFELTLLQQLHPEKVVNMHMTVSQHKDNLVMLYKVEPGACDKSFGINVARMTGFSESVVNRAEQLLNTLQVNNSQATNEINDKVGKVFDEFNAEKIKKMCADLLALRGHSNRFEEMKKIFF